MNQLRRLPQTARQSCPSDFKSVLAAQEFSSVAHAFAQRAPAMAAATAKHADRTFSIV
jgi:hypothetical protein